MDILYEYGIEYDDDDDDGMSCGVLQRVCSVDVGLISARDAT